MVNIQKVDLAANTTSTLLLDYTISRLEIQCRSANDILIWFDDASGFADGNYLTLKSGGYFWEDIPSDSIARRSTLYLRAASIVTVEVAQWFGDNV